MAMTVTATMSGATANEHIYLWVRVYTSATETGGASASGISPTGSATTASLTPNFSGSLPLWAITADNPGTPSAATGNTLDSSTLDADDWQAMFGRYTGTVTAATPVTFGVSFSGAPDYVTWACYELPGSGGSPSLDGSSPALASATGSGVKTVTSASFTPPAGSVIVAMACAGGTGSSGTLSMAVTDTGGGLTWTQRAGNATVTDQDAFVFTATVGGGGASAVLASASATAQQPGIAGQVTSQGTPVNVHATSGSVTGTWPAGSSRVAGRLLAAVVTSAAATSTAALNTPAGWTKQLEEPNSATAHSRSVIYTKTAAGADAAPTFTSTLSGTGGMDCMLFELIGADTTTITDTSGVFASGSSMVTLANATFTATTAGDPHAGAFAIAVFNQERAAANLTFTDSGTGWTKLLNGNGVSSVCQTAILTQSSPSTAGTLNDHGQFSTDTTAFGTAIVYVFLLGGASATATAGLATGAGAALNTAFTYVHAGLAAGAGTAQPPVFSRYITGLGGTGAGYFTDQAASPRMVLGDAVWALPGNAGRWNSGNWQADYDTYLATRAAQGFTVVYAKPIGTTQSGNIDDNGATFDSLYPFQGGAGANPSTGLTSAFWARIDYFLASALAKGITVFLNAIGYDSDFSSGPGPLFGKSTTEFTAYGTALGTRYASQPNLVWHLADDYFGENDSLITAFMTGVRGAGDTHLVSVENMPESDSRNTFDASPSVMAWGTANADYNFCYSYNVTYVGIEKAYAESSPLTVIQGDGYFYQGGSSYFATDDRAIRQDAWHAVSSGARGIIHGSESTWQWASTALASSSADWYYANNAGNIRAVMESLPGWQLLVPDTSSALVTAGRGTHASTFSSGGGGGQYEPAFTDSYVTASRGPDGGSGASLAVIYLSHGTTITIDQTKMVSGYTATWVDPVTGATSSATAGATYNSTAKGSNSQGDPDWVLVLQAPTAVSATAVLATGTGAAQGPPAAAGVNAAAATGTGAAQGPAITTAASVTAVLPSGTATAQNATASTSASGTGNAVLATSAATVLNPVPAIGVNATAATGTGTGQNATASTSSSGSATAVLATGAGAAQSPVPAIGVNGALATGAGGAQQPSAVTAASVTAGLATGTGAALNATGQTSGSANATAALATGTGTAQNPVPAIAVNAAAATGTGTALNAGRAASAGLASGTAAAQNPATVLAAQARAQAAQALAAALNATGAAVEPFTTGRLTASDAPLATLTASDTRTGGPG